MEIKPTSITAPTKKERFALRAMIFVGLIAISFFIYTISKSTNIGYKPLYILLMITMGYYCLKYLHEWYHYFSLSVPQKPEKYRNYTVDILTTYCAGEPFDMLEETLTAIQNITYPHTTWCCDEADDPQVKALCERLGVKHVTRTVKKNAKAGNINNALQYATGELCVVMDPDHIPCPEMLDHIIPYFEDEQLGYVQIVQAYYNQRESLVAKGAAQQTYQFYGPMMMCMNTYGTVQAIGANCTFRRKALDSIGGHAAGLSEDMHTAMQIHAKGWKTIYVPAILTRGLVPATLSSYFKQQLKWSRGTWDLLMITYPKLFTKFNWRQKLHYFLLPFHYLSGIIFFINFLIPVISLFTGQIPLKMDILSFSLAAVPLFGMTVFIRHYVQKWVAEETERGFHIVGGILQIGAWWVHSIGFFYTLLRKKVPYIPTPKNDNDPLPLILNLPNLIIAVVSLVAIVYGFAYNYNPYTLFMALLASMQIFFMVFIFSISGYIKKGGRVEAISRKVRSNTWLIKKTHGFIRNYSVPLSVILVAAFIYAYKETRKLPTFLPKPVPGLQVFYKGVFEPETNGDLTNVKKVLASNGSGENSISIYSFYISADSAGNTSLPKEELKPVYDNNAVPLINWLPFNMVSNSVDSALMADISLGKYDSSIKNFAYQIAGLQKPVFIRPQFSKNNLGEATSVKNVQPIQFITAWQHIHDIFDSAGAAEAIWIWNPFNPETVDEYYPGRKYADWVGVNILDKNEGDSTSNSFYMRYRLYHNTDVFLSGNPVMITEAGTIATDRRKWWAAMESNIDTAFNEIKSVIVVNNPPTSKNHFSADTRNLFNSFTNTSIAKALKELPISSTAANKSKTYELPDTLRGVLYDKGYHWFRNRHTMTRKTLQKDVIAMKNLGINTVERTMPGFYDDILDKLLIENNIKQIARFSIQAEPEMLEDKVQAKKEIDRVLRIVQDNKNKKNIIAWNLGDDMLFDLETETYKPEYFYYRNVYLVWLNDLCNRIRQIDNTRPIVMDLNWDSKGEERFAYYRKYVPNLNTCMLTGTIKYKEGLSKPLQPGMVWGKVPVELWKLNPSIKKSGFIPAWQDLENTDFITLNGILDMDGRQKALYPIVANTWAGMHLNTEEIPVIKILKPLQTTNVNASLLYSVLLSQDTTQWKFYSSKYSDIRFEWSLVRVDQYGTTMFIKKVAFGPYIQLQIPNEPQYYELYVEAIKGNSVRTARSTLNTPL